MADLKSSSWPKLWSRRCFGEEEVKVVDTFKGKHLKGQNINHSYTFLPTGKPAHRVVLADFVTTEDGTGLVHIAPAFGADDMQMATGKRSADHHDSRPDGTFIPEVRPWSGIFVKDADPLPLSEDLKNRGLLFRAGTLYTYVSILLALRYTTACIMPARPGISAPASSKTDWWLLNNEINWVPEPYQEWPVRQLA